MDRSNELKSLMSHAIARTLTEYGEVCWEEVAGVRFTVNGSRITEHTELRKAQGYCRVVSGGGIAFCPFERPDELEAALERAVQHAEQEHWGDVGALHMAPSPPVNAIARLALERAPAAVPFAEKAALVREYEAIIRETPEVSGTCLTYYDLERRRIFQSNHRIVIDQQQTICGLRWNITVGCSPHQVTLPSHFGAQDFMKAAGLHETVREEAQRAASLRQAEEIVSGEAPVVLDAELAGALLACIVSETSNAGCQLRSPRLRDLMTLGQTVAEPVLTVYDQSNAIEFPGFYVFDDEGCVARKTLLINHGLVAGRLHCRLTAGAFGEPVTGNGRLLTPDQPPVIIPSNIVIAAGNSSLEELLAPIDDGFFLVGCRHSSHADGGFLVGSRYGYRIKNGALAGLTRAAHLSGDSLKTLADITAVGDRGAMYAGWANSSPCLENYSIGNRIGYGGAPIRLRSARVW